MSRILTILMLGLSLWSAARADVGTALDRHILPGFSAFAEAARRLDLAAQADCRAAQVALAWNAAYDAWLRVADLRIGPSETGALPVAFWPDDRGFARRALQAMVSARDPAGRDPVAFADVSIAARGLVAMELLIHDDAFAGYGPGDYTCGLVQTVAADLASQAARLDAAWSGQFARALATAGAPGNTTFLTPDESLRAIFTQLLAGLDWTAEARLGRPLGTFDRPRPRLAEAWRSGRSLRNVMLAAQASQDLAHALAGRDLPRTDAAMERARAAADRIRDPGFQDLDDPQARLRVEILQQDIRAMRDAVADEIGTALGIAPGFNAQDGD